MNATEVYPQDDEVQFSEEYCPNCGHDCFSRSCSDCGGEGGHDGYEEDPLWYDEGDIIPCGICQGQGFFHWCPRCGWDMNIPARHNTQRHRGVALARYDLRLVPCILFVTANFTLEQVLKWEKETLK